MFEPDRLEAIQAAFPVLDRVTYLNTGTYGPMPAPALEAFTRAVAELERDGVACKRPLAQEADALRADLAALVAASPDEIAFTGNATDGINVILAGLSWEPGDEVITTDEEHEAMAHPLLYLQNMRGIRVRRVSVSHDPDTMIRRLAEARTAATRLIAFSHVTCETGTRLPATAMCSWATDHGIRSLLDTAQSLGAVSVDVGRIGCDFMAANGHKWLHGPTGTGFVYARSNYLPGLRLAYVGAGSLESADYSSGVCEPWTTGRRFEFGTRPWAQASGWAASLQWMQGQGMHAIRQHIEAVGAYAIDALRHVRGVRVLTPAEPCGRAGLISFAMEGQDAGELGRRLSLESAIVTRHVPHYNATRISVAQFTSPLHVDRLVRALHTGARTDR
jgi:selenocysteine lyase/cysteine desulfurase